MEHQDTVTIRKLDDIDTLSISEFIIFNKKIIYMLDKLFFRSGVHLTSVYGNHLIVIHDGIF